jgi:hypothetical protein
MRPLVNLEQDKHPTQFLCKHPTAETQAALCFSFPLTICFSHCPPPPAGPMVLAVPPPPKKKNLLAAILRHVKWIVNRNVIFISNQFVRVHDD